MYVESIRQAWGNRNLQSLCAIVLLRVIRSISRNRILLLLVYNRNSRLLYELQIKCVIIKKTNIHHVITYV